MKRKIIKRTLEIVIALTLILLLPLPFTKYISYNISTEAYALQKTITEQRSIANPVELTSITTQIADINKNIEYWKRISNIIPIYFTESFVNLEYVK